MYKELLLAAAERNCLHTRVFFHLTWLVAEKCLLNLP